VGDSSPKQGGGEQILGLNPNLCCYLAGHLVMDGSGNFYGTSFFGGTYGYGAVFKLTPSSPYGTYRHSEPTGDGRLLSGRLWRCLRDQAIAETKGC
jgi:uncharacterized repeat protein (TIGR03803 family)